MRFRPIIMTSFAFILGVVPLVLADRGRRRQPPVARHRGLRRDDHGNGAGGVLRAGLLRRRPVADRADQNGPPKPKAGEVLHIPLEDKPLAKEVEPAPPPPPLPAPATDGPATDGKPPSRPTGRPPSRRIARRRHDSPASVEP
jgi:hypothetical protein